MLNPFSLLSFFIQKRFVGFWYASGTPTFLIKLLKEKPEILLGLNSLMISEMMLDKFDIHRIDIEPLLFQTGYLTVKNKVYSGVKEDYLLKIPNLEVEEAFHLSIIAEFTEKGNTFAETSYKRLEEHLNAEDLQNVLIVLRSLFASIPYNLHINREAYYHSIFYAIMRVLGINMHAEVSVSGGRVDAVLELKDKVYVIEFKYKDCTPDVSAEEKRRLFDEALDEGINQIYNKGYQKKYIGSDKTIILVVFAILGRDNIEMRTEHPKE